MRTKEMTILTNDKNGGSSRDSESEEKAQTKTRCAKVERIKVGTARLRAASVKELKTNLLILGVARTSKNLWGEAFLEVGLTRAKINAIAVHSFCLVDDPFP